MTEGNAIPDTLEIATQTAAASVLTHALVMASILEDQHEAMAAAARRSRNNYMVELASRGTSVADLAALTRLDADYVENLLRESRADDD